MHAFCVGDGPPVVLVHGYGLSGAYMLPLARVLADASCSVFVPDLPGQGRSEPLRRREGIGDIADALGAWLEANALRRPFFVANSLGCQVVTELASRGSEWAGPLVLVGPTVDPERRNARHQLIGALRDSAAEPYSLLSLAARDNATTGIRGLLSTARIALADRIEDRLPLIEQPTVVVWGERDGFVSQGWVERVATLLPRGKLIRVPGESHAVHYTRPEVIGEIVVELFAEDGQAGA